MSELTITGTIKTFIPIENVVSKASGKEWKKQNFILANNDGYEGKEQIFCFEVFGDEKVENLNKYQKEGDSVKVSFNIGTNEYNNPTKGMQYFTKLSAWRIEKADKAPEPFTPPTVLEEESDLPF
jgi:single-stranded DNA-binding protein